MSASKPKPVDPELIHKLKAADGLTLLLEGEAAPGWLNGLGIVCGSAAFVERREILDGRGPIQVVGGIDVFRYDPDDLKFGKPVNKDHYFVTSGNTFQAYGPFKRENDHWLPKVPGYIRLVPVLERSSGGYVFMSYANNVWREWPLPESLIEG